jgi:PAS domain S-box-containing protein
MEITLPFHALVSVGYVIIVLYMLQFPEQSKYATVLGIVTTVFITLGYILTASAFKNELSVPVDRGLAVLAIWLAVYFSVRFKTLLGAEVKQKEKFQAILSNAKEGMLILDSMGKLVFSNSFAEQLFGYQGDELIGISIENLVTAPVSFSHSGNWQNYLTKPQDRSLESGHELQARRKDGSEFPVEISLGHFTDSEGSFAIMFVLDLSERKKALESLGEEQKLAQTYFELAPVLFMVLDKAGNITSINHYGSKLLGYLKEEVVGKNWFTTFLSAELRDDVFGYFQKLFTGTATEYQYENPLLTKQGNELEMSWRNTIIKDAHKESVAILCAGTDITQKKRQEKLAIAHHSFIQNQNDQLELKIRNRTSELSKAVHELQIVNHDLEKSQYLLTTVAHHFPDGVIGVLNKDFKYVFADGQELRNIGLLKRDNKGERVFDNIHPVLSSQAEEKLKEVFAGKQISYDAEMEGKTYTISSVPLPDEKSQVNEIMVVIKNITERKRIEKDLLKSVEKEKQLTEMKSKFVTMASHEFRTPLSTILSSVFLLENYRGQELEDNKTEHLSKIKRSVNNLTELLTDFISLGKLEEGKVKVVYSEINVRDFLQELIPEMELIRKSNQAIRFEYTGEENTIQLDKQLFRSILMNLIGNGIKYSAMNDEIKLSVRQTDHELTIKVSDRGIGIPAAEQRHIFKRFYRAHNAANIEGTGLGLNIVKKNVRLMKGKIEFQSKLNAGTTFTVTLPIVKDEPEKSAQRKTQLI